MNPRILVPIFAVIVTLLGSIHLYGLLPGVIATVVIVAIAIIVVRLTTTFS